MSDRLEASGGPRFVDHLDGLREALGDPRDYSWPPEYLEAFGVGEQPAFVDVADCGHPECNQDFWEDGHDDLYDQSTVNYVVALLDDAIERAKQSHPANGRDLDENRGLGLYKGQGVRRRLSNQWRRAKRRGISSLGNGMALNGLQWGAERGPASGPR